MDIAVTALEPGDRGLFEGLNDAAAAQGWPFVRWVTAENNYRGRGLYDRLAEKTHWVTYQKNTATD
ncbi:hypothetical protein A8C75_18050 [Marinobacterium aestuarii]|uniref:N-acetyltransferase domain-containing protein n=1 Tax=Marinobacterium aestuarii TaxID=1821621 RepID=A0A1A9F340_9GAMM|nr:hypothetical protein [Marinobacterium aestuarii]ANG64189.1 hypothetical protein A8C75_18050 [Marinobacterium aestuarii]